MEKHSLNDNLSRTFQTGVAVFTMLRGLIFFKEDKEIIDESNFYSELNNIFPLWIWGLIFILAGVLLLIACWLLPRKNKVALWFLVIAAVTCSIIYFFITSASMFNSTTWLPTLQFATLSGMYAIVAFFGGAEINGQRE